MRIAVTGANGFIGSEVVKQLLATGGSVEVLAIDFSSQYIPSEAKFIQCDLIAKASDDNLYEGLGRPDVLIHCAWRDGFNHSSDAHMHDLEGHWKFLKNMLDHGCHNVNVIGSMHEVGYFEGEVSQETPCRPTTPYGIAKNALRQLLLTYAPEFVKWLRTYYICTGSQRTKSIFAVISQKAESGEKTFPFVTGSNQYDFIELGRLAEFIVAASLQTEYRGIIELCSGKPVSLRDKVMEFISDNHYDIRPNFGAYPDRPYASPCIYGNASIIERIMQTGV